MPDETTRAMQSQRLGKLAANPKLSQERKQEIVSTQSRMPKTADVEGVITKETSKRALGSFKSGGRVKRTGLYKLHKNETVKRAPKRG